MPIDPVKIPQNVYVEDRIIGPITLRQIMIVMISVGVSYAIWATMKAAGPVSTTQTTVAWMPTVVGAAFAFVKINGISLLRIVLLLIEKIDKPSRRTWIPRQGIYVNIVTRTPKKKTADNTKAKHSGTHIEELSRVLDQGPQEETIEKESGETDTEDVQEPQELSSKPVKPERIQAESDGKPIDDIAIKPESNPPSGPAAGLLRDITPPSHA